MNRRRAIQTALTGVAATAVISAAPLELFASNQKSNIAGWNANGLSKPVLDIAQRWAVEAGNPILANQYTQDDVHQAAMAYRLVTDHLEALGFTRAAAQHLSLHKELLTYNDAAVERQYKTILSAGLHLDRSRYVEFAKMGYNNPKAMLKVAQYVHLHGAANFHALTVGRMRHTAKFAASPIGLSGIEPRFKRMQDEFAFDTFDTFDMGGAGPVYDGRWFSERTCFYLDWGLAYLAVIGLAAPGVGEALAVPLVIAWAVSKVGGC